MRLAFARHFCWAARTAQHFFTTMFGSNPGASITQSQLYSGPEGRFHGKKITNIC